MDERAERFKNLSRKYIAPLETTEGTLEFAGHQAAEAADAILRDKPGYIGVIPIGSMVRGYANQTSDIDLVVLLNDSHLENVEGINKIVYREQLSKYGKSKLNRCCE
jgi:predicted nucleotidyltransferase